MNGALERSLLRWGELDLLIGLGGVEFRLGLAALFNGLGQVDFVVLGQKHVLANVTQVQTYEVFIIPIYTVFCHLLPQLPLPTSGNSGTSSYTGSRNQ